jgi:hypothetical protein
MVEKTLAALRERRAALDQAIDRQVSRLNVLIGERNGCNHAIDLLTQPSVTQEESASEIASRATHDQAAVDNDSSRAH